jgi:hypothetical protein
MTIVVRPGFNSAQLLHELAKLESLVIDYDRIGSGIMPDQDQLATAPLIEDYVPTTRPLPCLVGRCTDHPSLSGPQIITTDLWMIAPELGWCRTFSRFYRLGREWKAEGA